MAELSFGQQLTLSIVSSLGTAGIVGLVGVLFFRQQHKVRLEEEARGELLKLRQQSFVEVVRALGTLISARIDLVVVHPDETHADRVRAEGEFAKAGDAAVRALMANLLLMPPDLAEALKQAIGAITKAETILAMDKVTHELYPILSSYLPRVPAGPRLVDLWSPPSTPEGGSAASAGGGTVAPI
jgi:hypothetical protein